MFSLHFAKRRPKIGSRPGTLVIRPDSPAPKIHVIHYSPDRVEEKDVADPAALCTAFSEETVTWVDIQGFGDESVIRRVAEMFSLHRLLIEDVINVPQRPKVEAYDEQLLIIVRMVRSDGTDEINMEQVSIVLGKNYVLTFQERYGDVLDPVRRRIRSGKGIIRRQGADYLAYAIFDTIVDGYYPVLESLGSYVEQLEDAVVERPTPDLLRDLNRIKNRLAHLRRAIWPQREAANSLARDDFALVDEQVQPYLRHTHDHCIYTAEVAEMYREMVSGLMNTYLSSVANRTNEVMKVLTIVATIFIPLTFLAGIYGMNFEHMPELHVKWAYPAIWFTMFATAFGMLTFFWRRGWIGPSGNAQARSTRPADDDDDLPARQSGH